MVNESIKDTCLDLVNYAAMAIMSMNNTGPYDMVLALMKVHEEAIRRLANWYIEPIDHLTDSTFHANLTQLQSE